ncbi:MAG TPA: hypothetical protein VHH73_09820 [Verrucomicrobiae bacterium]|nr:hypothetical protein [Verrucomicrobiae bacterium]
MNTHFQLRDLGLFLPRTDGIVDDRDGDSAPGNPQYCRCKCTFSEILPYYPLN